MDLDLLKRLSETPGVSGREERIRDVIRTAAGKLFDSYTVDAMGTLIATKKSSVKNAPRVLLACHMDEIGFYVKHIDERGFLRVIPAGGFDPRNLFARRVLIQASSGKDIIGLMNPGGRPIHIAKEEDKKKIPEVGEFLIDTCLPAAEVKTRVKIGDPVTLLQSFMELGEYVTGKAMDNRVAAFVAIEAMKKVKKPKYEVVFAATVQEEVGLRGAGPAAFATEPDIAITIDTTLEVDLPGVPADERCSKAGDGVAITIMDGSAIGDRKLIDELAGVADAKKIPYQLSIMARGGTDTGAIQRVRRGHRAMTLSIPTRYIHTVTETVHRRDLQAAIDLLAAWLEK